VAVSQAAVQRQAAAEQHVENGGRRHLVDGEGGEFAAAQRGDEPDQQQRPVAGTGQVRFGGPARGAPHLGGGAGVEDVKQPGRHQRGRLVGRSAMGASDAFPDGEDAGVTGRVGLVLQLVGEPDR